MYASGSTWTYNVMRAIAAADEPGRAVHGGFVNTLADVAALDASDDAIRVVKSHDLPADAAAALRRLAVGLCVTLRDPRDAVTSLMLYQRFPFDTALDWVGRSARFCEGMAGDPAALVLRFEAGFPDDPATLDRIAGAMCAGLAAADRESVFAQSRRAAVEAVIAGLPTSPTMRRDAQSGDLEDPETQWHAHHAGRSGEVGRWRRMLSADQARTVQRELRGFMERFGYAAPAVAVRGGTVRFSTPWT